MPQKRLVCRNKTLFLGINEEPKLVCLNKKLDPRIGVTPRENGPLGIASHQKKNALLEFVLAKYERNGAIGIGPFSCRFQRLVGPNGQLLHPLHDQATEFLEGQKKSPCWNSFWRNTSATVRLASVPFHVAFSGLWDRTANCSTRCMIKQQNSWKARKNRLALVNKHI
jgi:hypothetical protein